VILSAAVIIYYIISFSTEEYPSQIRIMAHTTGRRNHNPHQVRLHHNLWPFFAGGIYLSYLNRPIALILAVIAVLLQLIRVII
jgi:hypothetical protein